MFWYTNVKPSPLSSLPQATPSGSFVVLADHCQEFILRDASGYKVYLNNYCKPRFTPRRGFVFRSNQPMSDMTVTDLFCSAGGSSTGVVNAGATVRMALNHWKLVIETNNMNHPDTDHDCTDIQACDPRRYPRTTILIASPECVNE